MYVNRRSLIYLRIVIIDNAQFGLNYQNKGIVKEFRSMWSLDTLARAFTRDTCRNREFSEIFGILPETS